MNITRSISKKFNLSSKKIRKIDIYIEISYYCVFIRGILGVCAGLTQIILFLSIGSVGFLGVTADSGT